MMWEKVGSIHNSKPTFQNPNFESMNGLGKLCLNLSFTVKNKIGNLQHKRMVAF